MKSWQKHIRHTHVDKDNTSWCGKVLYSMDWTFTSVDHALYAIDQETTTQPCPACIKVITSLLNTEV